jgi:uncharacterized protein YqgC (DUF456 family)
VEPFLANILLFAGMTLGLVSIAFGLPGTIIILACIFVYAISTDFQAAIGIPFFAFLCVLTLIAETADNWLGAVGARRYGASKGSMWLSFLGGLAGAIFIGGPLALVFGPLGPVAGAFVGAFLIVIAYELYSGKRRSEALRAGWGTLLGRVAGMVLKLVIAVAMIVAVAASMLLGDGL